jgi:hypothetical protein
MQECSHIVVYSSVSLSYDMGTLLYHQFLFVVTQCKVRKGGQQQ